VHVTPKSSPVVQDDSLIDEMRSALQGDRQRAEIRRQTALAAPVAAGPDASPVKGSSPRRPRSLFAWLRRRS
jgi:hypothetical protein